jgi:hypothetical protein
MSWFDLLESVFTNVQLAVYRLRGELDVECVHQLRSVDTSLARLRDAMSKQRDPDTINRHARDTYMRALALAQMIYATPALKAVNRLLDVLSPYVTTVERSAREALLEGTSLEASLKKLFVA